MVSFEARSTSIFLRNAEKQATEAGKISARLSTGLRLVDSSADPGGVAIATSFKTASANARANRTNVSDAQRIVTLADQAARELDTITDTVLDLAELASTNEVTVRQRRALDTEADALVDDYLRIARTTAYGGRTLLDGTYTGVAIQTSSTAASSSRTLISIPNALTSSTLPTTDLTTVEGAAETADDFDSVSSNINLTVTSTSEQSANFAAIDAQLETTQRISDRVVDRIRSSNQADDLAARLKLSIRDNVLTAIAAQANLEPLSVGRLVDESLSSKKLQVTS